MQLFRIRVIFAAAGAAFFCASANLVGADAGSQSTNPPPSESIAWEAWDNRAFDRAGPSRFVLLDLEAVWCHWCHVMDQTTYRDPEVVKLIKAGYVPIKVDQDSRPDLAARYKDYGWPATIILDAKGSEIRKLSGYIEPEKMRQVLRQPRDEKHQPEASAQPQGSTSAAELVSPAVRAELAHRVIDSADPELGGLKTAHKFIDPDSVEYGLRQPGGEEQSLARLTLENSRKLSDPVWGGFYQYSTGGVWTNPHYEKIMRSQADNIRIYTLGASLLNDESLLEPPRRAADYLRQFLLSESGAFFSSQDADLKRGEHAAEYFSLADPARRSRGIPAIDKHIYTRENGQAIEALADLYAGTSDESLLRTAIAAAEWIAANRSLPGGGFRHDQSDISGPYLADSLAMGRAYLALYQVAAEKNYLDRARAAGHFIIENFPAAAEDSRPAAGFYSAPAGSFAPLPAVHSTQENISACRFFNLLWHYTNDQQFRTAAQTALRFLGRADTALESISEPGILLAAEELEQEPLHITAVGSKKDSAARKLFVAALKFPHPYKRIDWLDREEGPAANPDLQYPQLKRAAAYVCTNKRCSMPIYDPAEISTVVAELSAK